jgi:hypothetical protein
MSWFCTKAFSFELPGDWEEKTVNLHQRADEKAALMVTRNRREPGTDIDVEGAIRELPGGALVEREILHSRQVEVGPLDGQDVAVISRNLRAAEYHRIVCVGYYDLELSFQFAGVAAARDEVDARVEQALSTVQFVRR